MKIITALMITGLIVLLAANFAMADEAQDFIPVKIINNYSVNSSEAMGMAASEINPTVLSNKWQAGFGLGFHNDEAAAAAGLAKRLSKNKLLSAKIVHRFIENDKNDTDPTAVSLGLNIKF